MKKSRKQQNRSKKSTKASAPVQTPDRRAFMTKVAYGIGGIAIAGGIGVFSVNTVRASMAELDLSKVGNGTPSIVQIHDPACQLCTKLQKETRQALGAFDEEKLNYLVANITTADGATFAATYGVPHVTLLLFDGDGEVVQVLNGVRESDELEETFTTHFRRSRLR